MTHHFKILHKLNKRIKLVVLFSLVIVFAGAGTVLALTIAHKLTHAPIAVIQKNPTQSPSSLPAKTVPVRKPSPAQSPAPVTPTATKSAPVAAAPPVATPKPTPAPAPVITPSPSGDVPTLQPSSTTTVPAPSSSTATPKTTTNYKSTNWSGYMASGGVFKAVSGSWVVPSATSTSTTADSYDAAWIGIGGVTSSDLIQTGTVNIIAPSGAVTTEAFYELLPDAAQTIVSLTVTVGDTMSAAITETATNQWSLTITDVTTGKSFNKLLAYTSQLSSAEWIEEDPTLSGGTLAPLNNFGTVHFSGGLTKMNDTNVSIEASNAGSITMVNSSSTPIAVPSSLSGGTFSVTYH